MIYLINVTYYNKETKEILDLLKIGYTDNWNKRKSQYLLHNPGVQEIYLIDDGTEEQESKLHYKFKDLKYPDYGNEWFYYSEDIINYVKTVTLEELDKLPNNPNKDIKNFLKGKKEAKKIISYLFDTVEEVEKYSSDLVNKLGDTISSYTTILDYISQDPTIDQEKLRNYYKIKERSDTGIYTEDKIVNKEVSDFFRLYEGFTTMVEKMRLLCENNLSSESISIILAQIPESDPIKSYYMALGPDKLKRLGYRITAIRKELGVVVFNDRLLLDTIYSNFYVGERYKLSEIKEKLTNLYSLINYTKTPKVIDIQSYFKTKDLAIYEKDESGNRKKSRGIELVESYEQKIREDLKYSN